MFPFFTLGSSWPTPPWMTTMGLPGQNSAPTPAQDPAMAMAEAVTKSMADMAARMMAPFLGGFPMPGMASGSGKGASDASADGFPAGPFSFGAVNTPFSPLGNPMVAMASLAPMMAPLMGPMMAQAMRAASRAASAVSEGLDQGSGAVTVAIKDTSGPVAMFIGVMVAPADQVANAGGAWDTAEGVTLEMPGLPQIAHKG